MGKTSQDVQNNGAPSARVCFSYVLNLSVHVCVCHLGVLLISLALCADAAIGNVQEKAMKLHNGSNSEMVDFQY